MIVDFPGGGYLPMSFEYISPGKTRGNETSLPTILAVCKDS
jgi:hypothetical protein